MFLGVKLLACNTNCQRERLGLLNLGWRAQWLAASHLCWEPQAKEHAKDPHWQHSLRSKPPPPRDTDNGQAGGLGRGGRWLEGGQGEIGDICDTLNNI